MTTPQPPSYHDYWTEALKASAPYHGLTGSGARWDAPVVIHGARIITGSGAEPIEHGALVFEGERIVAVGRESEVQSPRGAHTIDADGMTLMPGLIDCHVHLNGRWGYDVLDLLQTSPSLGLLYTVPNARATLEAGVTTVRDAGLSPAGARQAIERGFFPGPRMLTAVTILSQTGGHGDNFMPCCADLSGMVAGKAIMPDIPHNVVDGVDAMRHKVREVLRAGADWIKLCTSGGVLSASDAPESAQFSVEEIRVAVEEAAAQGKRCMAHAQSNQGIKNAIIAGVASIEHGIYLDDEAIAMMLERGVYLVPTLIAPQDVVDAAEANPGMLPAYAIEKAGRVIEAHRRSFRLAVEAGVKIAMGTDTGVGPHGGNARELDMMARYGGMTNMQAIVASTRVAAELLRLDEQTGTVAAGKLADLLVVDGDPLADLGILAQPDRLALVVKAGAAARDRLTAARR
jgi:imidazolonepropionase-like amidohydrolase